MSAVTVRPLAPHEGALYRDLRLRALADAPEAFGATLEAARALPHATWAERLAADRASTLPLVALRGDAPVGLAWGVLDGPLAHVYQMWVAPDARGLGAGRRLLGALVDWARERGARRVVLGVTEGNGAAEALYARAGFVATGEAQPLRPGAALVSHTMALDL